MNSEILVVGSYVTDVMGRGPKIPVVGETVKGSYFKIGPGGKGANQAVAAARAGGKTAMIAKVGKDDFGEMALQNFRKEKINTVGLMTSETFQTGIALILVNDKTGDNSILVVPGACEHLDKPEITDSMLKFRHAKALLLQYEINLEAILQSLDTAAAMGLTVICNPAPAMMIPEKYYSLIDFFTPNETEAEFLTGIRIDSPEDAKKAAKLLCGKGIKNVVITMGSKGSFIYNRIGTESYIPAFKVDVIDTTGAGDAFNGAFAVALVEGKAIVDATKFATAAAALSVTKIGTAIAMPQRDEIEAFLVGKSREA